MVHPRNVWVLAGALALVTIGCQPQSSGTPSPSGSSDPRSKIPAGYLPSVDRTKALTDLTEFGKFYLAQAAGGTPPHSAEELDLARQSPKLNLAIKDGSYIVAWGADPARGAGVLAYVKDAPTKGGVVLTLDGAARDVTADEFKTLQVK